MLLYIFDQSFTQIGILDNYISLQWTEDYHGSGVFTLVCSDSPDNTSMLQQGYFVYKKGKRTAMLIRYVGRDAEGQRITVNGYTTLALLAQRIVWPAQNIRNVEAGMYDVVAQSLGKTAASLAASSRKYDAKIAAINQRTAELSGIVSGLYAKKNEISTTGELADQLNAQIESKESAGQDPPSLWVWRLAKYTARLERLKVEIPNDVAALNEAGVGFALNYNEYENAFNMSQSEMNTVVSSWSAHAKAQALRWYQMETDESRRLESIALARDIDGLRGYPYEMEAQFFGVGLLDALSALGAESDLGYYMAFDYQNKRHVFTVYQGLDRTHGQTLNAPAVFATEYGNLANTIITDDMSMFRNVAYVAGSGEGEERIHLVVGNASGLDRFELFVDARDLQLESTDSEGNTVALTYEEYDALLLSRGLEKLNEHIRSEAFKGEIDPGAWGSDYYLGDKITCLSSRYGVRLDVRIMQYTEVVENNMTKLKVSLGTPEVSLYQEVNSWI